MNIVAMTANLTRDPVLEQRGGQTVCDLRVAERKGAGDPLYITVTVFDEEAERCATYLRKGRLVAITGRLRYREWQGKDGKRSEHTIAASWVEFLPGGSRSDEEPAPIAEPLAPVPAA